MLPCLILGRIGTHSAGRRGRQSFSEHRRSCLCLDDVAYVGGVKVGIFVFNLLLTWHQQNVRNLRILSPLLNGKPRTTIFRHLQSSGFISGSDWPHHHPLWATCKFSGSNPRLIGCMIVIPAAFGRCFYPVSAAAPKFKPEQEAGR